MSILLRIANQTCKSTASTSELLINDISAIASVEFATLRTLTAAFVGSNHGSGHRAAPRCRLRVPLPPRRRHGVAMAPVVERQHAAGGLSGFKVKPTSLDY
jgi:hypothetical protein